MGNKEQIYGRNDMVMLDKHNKIYGSLGIIEPYVFDTKTGETIVMENPKKGKFEDVVTEFSVYGKSTQVTTIGAQLFDVDAGGTGWLNQETGAFIVNNDNYVSEYIPVKRGAQYYINYDISQYVYSYDSSKQFLRKETYKNSFAVGDDVFYIRFAISNNKEVALKKAKTIMLNEGSSAKPYEPYTGGKPSPSIEYPQEIVSAGDKGEIGVSVYGGNLIPETQIVDVSFNKKEEPQILTLKTPNGLSGIPVPTGGNYTDSNGKQWVCDEIDFGRGKYVQRVKKIFVNGNCKKEKEQSNGLYRAAYIDNSLSDNVTGILCDKLFRSEDLFIERCTQGYGRIYLSIFLNRLKNGENSTEEDLNEFLRENPLTFLCVLKRPIERDLTQEEVETYKALHTNYPTTVIMNDENAGMKVTYKQLESKTRVVN